MSANVSRRGFVTGAAATLGLFAVGCRDDALAPTRPGRRPLRADLPPDVAYAEDFASASYQVGLQRWPSPEAPDWAATYDRNGQYQSGFIRVVPGFVAGSPRAAYGHYVDNEADGLVILRLIRPNLPIGDQRFSATVWSGAPGTGTVAYTSIGVRWATNGAVDGYSALFQGWDGTLVLKRWDGGTQVDLATASTGLGPGAHTLAVEAVGTGASVTLKVYVDGALWITHVDTSPSRKTGGGPALLVYASQNAGEFEPSWRNLIYQNLAGPAPGGDPGPMFAALPRVYYRPELPAVTQTRTLAADGTWNDLQQLVNAAAASGQAHVNVVIPRGVDLTGSELTLPAKTNGTGWVSITCADYFSTFTRGRRLRRDQFALLPTLRLDRALPLVATVAGPGGADANRYALLGLRLTAVGNASWEQYGAFMYVRVGSHPYVNGVLQAQGPSGAWMPDEIVLRHCLFTVPDVGLPAKGVKRAIEYNAKRVDVSDNVFDRMGGPWWSDASCFGGVDFAGGGVMVENNDMCGGGINILLGGDYAPSGRVGTDIVIRRNRIRRTQAMKDAGWVVKALVETKTGERWLIEENEMDRSWTSGQDGPGIAIKSSTEAQNPVATYCRDVTVRRNRVLNCRQPLVLQVGGEGHGPTAIPVRNVDVYDNVFEGGTDVESGASASRLCIIGARQDRRDEAIAAGRTEESLRLYGYNLRHNTFAQRGGYYVNNVISADQARNPDGTVTGYGSTSSAPNPATLPPDGLLLVDNVFVSSEYGVLKDEGGISAGFYLRRMGWTVRGNVFGGGLGLNDSQFAPEYPQQAGLTPSYFAGSDANIGFAGLSSRDYRLAPNSQYKGKASDGKDPGADFAAIDAALAGVASGVNV